MKAQLNICPQTALIPGDIHETRIQNHGRQSGCGPRCLRLQRGSRHLSHYPLFHHGAPDATHVIIAMGSVCETITEVIDYLEANDPSAKFGLVKVHLYRPFCNEHLIRLLPDTVTQITVLDRTKEPGTIEEPLYLDVAAALKDSAFPQVPIFGGRYGLSSKNTTHCYYPLYSLWLPIQSMGTNRFRRQGFLLSGHV